MVDHVPAHLHNLDLDMAQREHFAGLGGEGRDMGSSMGTRQELAGRSCAILGIVLSRRRIGVMGRHVDRFAGLVGASFPNRRDIGVILGFFPAALGAFASFYG